MHTDNDIMTMYTIEDINNISLTKYSYTLEAGVTDVIRKLGEEFGVSIGDIRPRQLRSPASSQDIWKKHASEPFKVTQFDKKEGLTKSISEFRLNMNKLSNKNYDSLYEKMIILIDEILSVEETEETPMDERHKQIVNCIFDTANNNQFYAEIYAKLYKSLMEKYDFCKEMASTIIPVYNDSLQNIRYIDPNEDYDGFCAVNKENEKRKANWSFIIHLMKQDILEIDHLVKVFDKMCEIIDAQMDDEKMSSITDEITANIFVLISSAMDNMMQLDVWANIYERIQAYSKYKHKDHPGLSSRTIFKYMDIVDLVKKHSK